MVHGTPLSQDASTHQIWDSRSKNGTQHSPIPRCIHIHIKFGIPTSKNIGDMHRTRSGTDWLKEGWMDRQCDYYEDQVKCQGHIDPKIVCDTPTSQDASTHRIWKSYLKECRWYVLDTKRLLYASQSSFGGIKNSSTACDLPCLMH